MSKRRFKIMHILPCKDTKKSQNYDFFLIFLIVMIQKSQKSINHRSDIVLIKKPTKRQAFYVLKNKIRYSQKIQLFQCAYHNIHR